MKVFHKTLIFVLGQGFKLVKAVLCECILKHPRGEMGIDVLKDFALVISLSEEFRNKLCHGHNKGLPPFLGERVCVAWELLQERLLIRIVLGSCSVSGSQKHRYADGCDVRNKVNEGEVGARIDLLGAAFTYQLLGQSMIEQGVAHLLESFLDAFGVTVGRHIR